MHRNNFDRFFLVVMLSLITCLVPSSQQAAPGISVPDYGTVWLLNSPSDSKNLIQLKDVATKLNVHRGANFGRQMTWPITTKAKQTVEIPGTAATVRIPETTAPVLLVRDIMRENDAATLAVATPASDQGWKPAILHLKAGKGVRLVDTLSLSLFTGHHSRESNSIEFNSERINGTPWVRITVARTLEPGEYAFTWIPEAANASATVVYDFGVGPAPDVKK